MPTIIEINVQTGEQIEREMTTEEIADLPLVQTAPIPQSVTMRQARLALLGAGHLAGVDAAIAAIPDDMQRQAAQIEWEYAQTVDRNAPFTQTLALALGLSDADLDALFTAAAAL